MQRKSGSVKSSLIFLVALMLLILVTLAGSHAEMITIDFDNLPDGTPVSNGTCITDSYKDLGVRFSCAGTYPDFHKDYCAYAYSNSHAVSGTNIMGGNIIGFRYQFLNFSLCYGVAEFATPTDYVSLYGVGDPFMVYAYNENDELIGRFSSTNPLLKIYAADNPIKKITFGSWTGAYYTFFDQLTFNKAESGVAVNMVWTSDPADPNNTPKVDFKPGNKIRYNVDFTVQGPDLLYFVKAVGKAKNTSGNYWLTSFSKSGKLSSGSYHWWWDKSIPEDASMPSKAKEIVAIKMFDFAKSLQIDVEQKAIRFDIF
jgi:hypothetical protein